MDPDRRIGHVPEKFRAGFKLLDKFSGQWEQIHRASERNISKSRLALDKINSLGRHSIERLKVLEDFISSYQALSKLDEQITNISCDLNNMESSFIKIEECLSALAMRNEETNCERFIRDYEGNYEALAQREKIQSELARDRLMSEHLQRVQQFESIQQQALEERRKVLAKEFEAEKARYLERANTSNDA